MNEDLHSELADIRYCLLVLIALQANDHSHSRWFQLFTVFLLFVPLLAKVLGMAARFLRRRYGKIADVN